MKHADLIRILADEGCVLARSVGKHDVYRNVITGASSPVPRHRELNENTCRSIIRILSSPDPKP